MKEITVKQTKTGKGVFANKDFKKGDHILQFHGKVYSIADNPRGFYAENNHFLQISDTLYLGPTRTPDNYVNHSCNPNSWVKIGDKVILIALKDIKKGEQITFDYSLSADEDGWEMDCLCGDNKCRGKIGSFKYLHQDIQKNYISLGIVPDFIITKLKK